MDVVVGRLVAGPVVLVVIVVVGDAVVVQGSWSSEPGVPRASSPVAAA